LHTFILQYIELNLLSMPELCIFTNYQTVFQYFDFMLNSLYITTIYIKGQQPFQTTTSGSQ